MSNSFSIEASTISIAKTREERLVDDLQTFSNIAEDNLPLALAVCGANWQINDKHSLFFGIRNMNEDYFTSPVTSFFTNSSCGVYPTISANYDIANYPVASVGVHYRYGPTPSPSPKGRGEVTSPINGSSEDVVSTPLHSREGSGVGLQVSLYNGKGYNHFTGRENVFRFCPKSDGLFGLAEATYSRRGSCYFVGNAVYWGGSSSNNIKGSSGISVNVTLEGSNLSLAEGELANPRFPEIKDARTVKRSHINISVLDAVAPLHGATLLLLGKPGAFDTPANDEYDPVG